VNVRPDPVNVRPDPVNGRPPGNTPTRPRPRIRPAGNHRDRLPPGEHRPEVALLGEIRAPSSRRGASRDPRHPRSRRDPPRASIHVDHRMPQNLPHGPEFRHPRNDETARRITSQLQPDSRHFENGYISGPGPRGELPPGDPQRRQNDHRLELPPGTTRRADSRPPTGHRNADKTTSRPVTAGHLAPGDPLVDLRLLPATLATALSRTLQPPNPGPRRLSLGLPCPPTRSRPDTLDLPPGALSRPPIASPPPGALAPSPATHRPTRADRALTPSLARPPTLPDSRPHKGGLWENIAHAARAWQGRCPGEVPGFDRSGGCIGTPRPCWTSENPGLVFQCFRGVASQVNIISLTGRSGRRGKCRVSGGWGECSRGESRLARRGGICRGVGVRWHSERERLRERSGGVVGDTGRETVCVGGRVRVGGRVEGCRWVVRWERAVDLSTCSLCLLSLSWRRWLSITFF